MLCIQSHNLKASFNLAMEEYLLKEFKEDIFFVYRNEDAVIVGKHQNAHAESNALFLHEQHIPLYRRISGGGTVFHDKGNLNYGFISHTKAPAQVSFNRFSNLIIGFLKSIGIDANKNQRNSIETQGLKISGTAEHIFKNTVLHHGTLLFSSNLDLLSNSLASHPERYQHKAVPSVRSKVGNLSDYLPNISVEAFSELFMKFVLHTSSDNLSYLLKTKDINNIEIISKERYQQRKWNYGYSPPYTFQDRWEYEGKTQQIDLGVKDGFIENIHLKLSFLPEEITYNIENAIIEHPHSIESFKAVLHRLSSNHIKQIIQHSF